MKNLCLFLLALFISATSIAQNGINYKALIKDANGDVVANQAIIIYFQILEGGTTIVYDEEHNPTTDANGIVIVNIGEGDVESGNFLTIDWGLENHFLSVQMDIGDGNGKEDLGTTEFKSVPYAKVAERLSTSTTKSLAFPNGLENMEPITVGGAINYTVPSGKNLYITNFRTFTVDPFAEDPIIDKLQILNNSGQLLTVMENRANNVLYGNFVPLPIILAQNEKVILEANSSFNGFLVDAGEVIPFSYKFNSDTDEYIVPTNKKLFISTLSNNIAIDINTFFEQNLKVNNIIVYTGTGNSYNQTGITYPGYSFFNPIMANSSDIITAPEDLTIYGYLLDK